MKKIALALDYCPVSSEALKQAVRIAESDGAVVEVLHVFDERIRADLTDHKVPFEHDRVLHGAQERLHDFVETAVPGTQVHVGENVTIGHPFDEMVDFVEREEPDCLVLGLHGKHHPHQEIGVLAAKCVRELPVPVLLVSDGGSGVFRHVVACIDFSSVSRKVAEAAIEAAKRDDAELHFLHVFRPLGLTLGAMDEYMPDYALLPEEEVIMGKKRQLNDFKEQFHDELKGLVADNHVVCDLDVGGAIRRFIKGKSGCLVVIGTTGRTGLRRYFTLGTTAEKVVRNSPCEILAIKPDGFAGPKAQKS